MKYILGGIIALALILGGWWLLQERDDTGMNNGEESSMEDGTGAAGTMLAGSGDAPTHDAEGNPLIGGDARVSIDVDANTKSFTVLGSNFAYDITEMRVKEGDTVTVTLRSVEGFHDWVVDEFDAATERVSKDGETTVTFVADTKGTYEYYCSVGEHRANGMVGTLIVE